MAFYVKNLCIGCCKIVYKLLISHPNPDSGLNF